MAEPIELPKYAFVAGEISPDLFGRSDLEKYDLALARATNWFVDYHGGISTRQGFRFVDMIQNDDLIVRLFPFRFAPSVDSTYGILFGGTYIRFIQDGSYVYEAAKNITGITQANPGVVTSNAHGYANGDLIRIAGVSGMTQVNERTFVVAGVTANTFQLKDVWGGNINTTGYTAYVSGGTVARVYTIASPYTNADLPLLRAHQARSTVTFTHPDYAPYILTRTAHTSWAIALEARGPPISQPVAPTVTPSAAGAAGVGFVVVSVDKNGNESIGSRPGFTKASAYYADPAVGGSVLVTWPGVAGAVKYHVYRTRIAPVGTDLNNGAEFGFVGVAYGPAFTDNNITPDFTQQPPTLHDPFANGAIEFIPVTAGGGGYTDAAVVSATIGTGLIAYPVVVAGAIVGIFIASGGRGYTSASVISVTVGAGATFGAPTVTPASDNNPRVSTVFQQRKVYAGTDNKPLTVNASKPADYQNFNESLIIQEDDAYEFELDSEQVAPILHLLPTRSGLVIMSQAIIAQLVGGQGVAVTPVNALADPQSYSGCSALPPLPIDNDVLYVEGKGTTVRLLTYNDFTKIFAGQDLSILSSHLFAPDNTLVSWAWASEPDKLVWAVREDGVMINLILVKEQNVFGWSTAQTQGLFKEVICLQEGNEDTVYTVVKRYIGGRYVQYIEEAFPRIVDDVENAWCVDSGLQLSATYPAATLTAASASGSAVVFTASAAVFGAGDVGKVIRGGGCKAYITGFTDTTHVTCNIVRDFTAILPEDGRPLPLPSGEWTMDAPVTTVGGLWHLEGKTVKILADGNVLPDAVVTNGAVTLAQGATRVVVGLGYRCIAQTLPPTTTSAVIEGKRKRNIAVLARMNNARGLKIGGSLDNLYPLKERTTEPYAEPTRLQRGLKRLPISDRFSREGQIYFVQDDPLPATLLSFISELDLGDVDQ